ncbi:MAG: hypothetical protein ACOVQY_03230 [Erythrobacter sp.]|jgi:hypothetical protein
MKTFATRMTALLAASAMVVPTLPAMAQTPGSVRDLVGAKAAGGESDLEYRGFHYVTGSTKNNRKFNYYWNGNTKECVKVVTYDGRFETITSTSASDCNQRGGSGDKAAAIAVGAAAILGIAALASKSHHRDDKYQDERSTAEFERGYRDGLYNHAYHNYGRSDAYSHGFEEGVRERGHESSYRPGNHNSYGGYSGYANVNDLEGRARDNAVNQLNSRGFVLRDSKRVEDGRYMTFWRSQSNQCVIVHSQNGYVVSVETVSARTCSY